MLHIKSGRQWWVATLVLFVGIVVGARWLYIRPVAAQEGRRTFADRQEREAHRRAIEELGRSGDERQLSQLVEVLRSDRDFLIRSAAAEALGNLRSELGLPALVAALDDASPDVRAAAALALARLGRPQGIPPLRRRLQDAEPIVRSAAAQALGKLGAEQALPDLVERLSDAEPEVRTSAAEALGMLGRREAVEPLLRALGDSNLYVRSRAATSLGMLGDPRAVFGVSALLQDKERTVRASAADALGRFRDRQAVLPLLEALRDREAAVRQNAAFALGKIGDETAADALVDALRDEDARVRARAVDALGALTIPRTLDAIVDSLRDSDPLVRTLAVQALGNFNDARATEALVQTLAAEDALLRRRAVESLAKIGDPRTLPAVQTALGDANPAVRASAVAALPRIGGKQMLPVLLTALQSDDAAVQSTAAFALARLGAEEAFAEVVEAVGRMKFEDVLNRRAAIVGFFNAVPESRPKLEGLVQSPKALQRRGALLGLMVVVVPPAATDTFLEALADSDPEVRRAALAALARTDPLRFAQATAQRLADEPDPAIRVTWLSQLMGIQEMPAALAETLRGLARNDVAPEVRQAAVAALDRLRLPRVILPGSSGALPLFADVTLPPAPAPTRLPTGLPFLPPALPPAPVIAPPTVTVAPPETVARPVAPPMALPSRPPAILPLVATVPAPAIPDIPPGVAPVLESPLTETPPRLATAPPPATPSPTGTRHSPSPVRPVGSPTTPATPEKVATARVAVRRLPLRRLPEARTAPVWVSLGRAFPPGSLGVDDLIARNEVQVIGCLERLVAAQMTFQMHSGGRFASLTELQAQGLVLPIADQDYALTLYVTEATPVSPADFFVLATPRLPGLTGRRAFYVDASGVIRSNDAGQQWFPSARQWTPIRRRPAA